MDGRDAHRERLVGPAARRGPNPDGRSNTDVVRPGVNGLDITRRPRGMWIIDFGTNMPIDQAALYEAPFECVREHVMPAREESRSTRREWWLHERPRVDMRRALTGLSRFAGTPDFAKHRLFIWLPAGTLADHQLIVFARDDDYFFGVLHSRPHELWARGMGTQLREVESAFRCSPATTFETLPLPPEPAADVATEVAEATRQLDTLRCGWLDPPGASPAELARRTPTNLYNQQPTWLTQTHARLDRAVHEAYGRRYPLEDDDVLERLLELNLERAALATT